MTGIKLKMRLMAVTRVHLLKILIIHSCNCPCLLIWNGASPANLLSTMAKIGVNLQDLAGGDAIRQTGRG